MKKIFLLVLFSFLILELNANEYKINEHNNISHKFYTYLELFKDINSSYNKENLEQL